jgi:hypothetical protein
MPEGPREMRKRLACTMHACLSAGEYDESGLPLGRESLGKLT